MPPSSKKRAYLSPRCRSPTPSGRFMLWHAQSTVPIPDETVPSTSRSGLSTASCATHVLRWRECQNMLSLRSPPTYLLRLVPVLLQMRHVLLNVPGKRPPFAQTRIPFLARNVLPVKAEIGIEGKVEGIDKPGGHQCLLLSVQRANLRLLEWDISPILRQILSRMRTGRAQ